MDSNQERALSRLSKKRNSHLLTGVSSICASLSADHTGARVAPIILRRSSSATCGPLEMSEYATANPQRPGRIFCPARKSTFNIDRALLSENPGVIQPAAFDLDGIVITPARKCTGG
jgi:hypothetical protein